MQITRRLLTTPPPHLCTRVGPRFAGKFGPRSSLARLRRRALDDSTIAGVIPTCTGDLREASLRIWPCEEVVAAIAFAWCAAAFAQLRGRRKHVAFWKAKNRPFLSRLHWGEIPMSRSATSLTGSTPDSAPFDNSPSSNVASAEASPSLR